MSKLFGVQYPLSQARIIALGIGLYRTTSFKKGTGKGPEAIRKASASLEAFDYETRTEVLEKNPVHDLGNLNARKGFEKALEGIERKVSEINKIKKVPLLLGGEHSITIPAAKAVRKEKPLVIIFDAHADLRQEFNGKRICHATCSRRILDFIPKKDFLQLGVRSLSKEEFDFIKKNNLKTVFIEEIKENLVKIRKLIEKASKNRKIYLSIDIDVFDPSIAPGTGTPEHNGMAYAEFRELVKGIKGKIIGFDIVEVLPDKELITPLLAGKILVDLMASKEF